MKKIVILILLLIIGLYACNPTEETHVNIMVPNGSPAISQMAFEYEKPLIDNMTYSIDRVSGPDNLAAAFGSESHGIIYAPTNLGARLIATGVPYKFAATINWGNFHLASQQPLSSLQDLENQEIIVFGQSSTPDIVLQTILEQHSFDNPPTIQYVDSVQTANASLMEDSTRIVLLAEPVLSVAGQNIEGLNTLDLQVLWQDITGDEAFPQAGIFVHKDIPDQVIEDYLLQIESAINKLHENTSVVAAYGEALEYPFPTPIIESSIPRSNIQFMRAKESRDALEFYFDKIMALNSELLNNQMPDDDFYR